jgi:hypothetical protein
MDRITAQVLSAKNVVRHGSEFRLLDELPPDHSAFTDSVDSVAEFVGDLKLLCDTYFASQQKERITNYEDIAYVARQIEDGLV